LTINVVRLLVPLYLGRGIADRAASFVDADWAPRLVNNGAETAAPGGELRSTTAPDLIGHASSPLGKETWLPWGVTT